MKIRKEVVFGVFFIIVAVACFSFFLRNQREKNRSGFAERIFELGNNPTESIESLERAIALYENRIEQHVKDAAQTGVYWKILAIRFQDRGLHNEALHALEQAIYYNPGDPVLHYLTGVSAALVAKNHHDFPGNANTERVRLYNLAEESFLNAINLDGNYLRPRYSIGVLYAFDLDKPENAIPHLLRGLEISRNDVDTMFVLARAYFMISSYQEAVEVYDRIISTTRDAEKKIEAQNNRQLVMGRIYG